MNIQLCRKPYCRPHINIIINIIYYCYCYSIPGNYLLFGFSVFHTPTLKSLWRFWIGWCSFPKTHHHKHMHLMRQTEPARYSTLTVEIMLFELWNMRAGKITAVCFYSVVIVVYVIFIGWMVFGHGARTSSPFFSLYYCCLVLNISIHFLFLSLNLESTLQFFDVYENIGTIFPNKNELKNIYFVFRHRRIKFRSAVRTSVRHFRYWMNIAMLQLYIYSYYMLLVTIYEWYLQNAVRPADNGDSAGNRNPLKLDGIHDKFWYGDW